MLKPPASQYVCIFSYKANFGHSKTLKNLSFATLGMLEINESDPK